jgi:hypothetical protein
MAMFGVDFKNFLFFLNFEMVQSDQSSNKAKIIFFYHNNDNDIMPQKNKKTTA